MGTISGSFKSAISELFVLVSVLTLIGCSGSKSAEKDFLDDIKNQGPVALSASDPYSPANLLVNYQIEKSEIVAGFVKYNGAPQAIELVSGWFKDPLVTYYYPKRREFYTVSRETGDWNLIGPRRIDQEHLKIIQQLELSDGPVALHTQLVEQENTISKSLALTGSNLTNPMEPRVDPFRERLDKVIASLSRQGQPELAEVNERGDIQHIVRFPYENLDLLAIWYTFDRANSERIKRINQLRDDSVLQENQKVLVPAYLVHNRNKLTPSGLQLLSNEFSKEELGLK